MFSQTTEYALRAMACLAMAPDELVPTSTLAERTKVPANYLAKVLQQLASGGLIKGRRGVGGGYKLAKDSRTRPRYWRSSTRWGSCDGSNRARGILGHGNNLCSLHRAIDNATGAVMKLFGDVTLKQLVDDPKCPNRPLCEPARPAMPHGLGGAKR